MKNQFSASTSESSLLELSDIDDLRDESVDLLDSDEEEWLVSDEEDSVESFGVLSFFVAIFGVSTLGVVFCVSTLVIFNSVICVYAYSLCALI